MLRTSASNLVRKSLVRSSPAIASRAASTHAISNPTLANIEKRWEGMPLQEQAELWMTLRDRMRSNWTELTLAEKKAGASLDFSFPIHITSYQKYLPHSRERLSSQPVINNHRHLQSIHYTVSPMSRLSLAFIILDELQLHHLDPVINSCP